MVINELLPNPTGKDASGEFIELLNNSASRVSLGGYVLKDKSGKKYLLHGELGPNAYLSLPYAVTKINLKNTGDAIYLFDPTGQQIDAAEYLLQAKEGASLARRDDGTFTFTDTPTPGSTNTFREVYVQKENFMFERAGATLSNSLPNIEAWLLILLTSITLTALVIYFLKDAIHPKEYILE